MKKKNYLTLDDEFIQYCKLNNIDDIEKFAKQVFDRGFTIIKYGHKPQLTIHESALEVIENWKKSSLLVDLKPMSDDNPIIEMITFKPEQKIEEPIKNKKDLYDE